MPTSKEVYEAVEAFAPLHAAMQGDNIGFLAGRDDLAVSKVMVALDITPWVIEEAYKWGAQMIVSHHPVFFDLKAVTNASPEGSNVISLLEKKMAAVCMHTNLDSVVGGVNDTLAELIGVSGGKLGEMIYFSEKGITPHEENDRPYGLARVGYLKQETPVRQFAENIKKVLSCNGVRYLDCAKPAYRVAVGCGSCGNLFDEAVSFGCDTFVTADIKYDLFLKARQLNINLIDAGHFRTENVVCPVLLRVIREAFPELEVRISQTLTEDAVFI